MACFYQSASALATTAIIFEFLCLFGICGSIRYLGYEAEWRDKEDHEKRSILIINPSQGSTTDGIITGWHVYTTRGRRSQVVHLQIWRPIDPTPTPTPASSPYRRYLRVNETAIAAQWVGHNYFALWPRDRIPVQRGDVLGIFFPGYNPIPWSAVPCNHSNEHLLNASRWRFVAGGGVEAAFERSGREPNPCRRYSLNATIMDRYEVERYDYEYDLTTDGRYERRPYGPYLRRRRYNGCASITPDAPTALLCLLAALAVAASYLHPIRPKHTPWLTS